MSSRPSQILSNSPSSGPNRSFDFVIVELEFQLRCSRTGRVVTAESKTVRLAFSRVEWKFRRRYNRIGGVTAAKSKTFIMRSNPKLFDSTSSWRNRNFDFIMAKLKKCYGPMDNFPTRLRRCKLERFPWPNRRLSNSPLSWPDRRCCYGRIPDFSTRLHHGRIETLTSSWPNQRVVEAKSKTFRLSFVTAEVEI